MKVHSKKQSRLRRAKRTRCKIQRLGAVRLSVFRTSKHIYAQLIAPNASKVLAGVSTLDKAVREAAGYPGNVKAAALVGKAIAEKAKTLGLKTVAFDRSGYKFHGRVKALADAAREAGLEF